jgi:putative membrane protein
MLMSLRRLPVVGLLACLFVLLAPVPAGAQGAVNDQDRAFLVAAHQSNLAEIAAGQAAQAQATTEEVREHGQRFIVDHTALDADVTRVAAALGVQLPATPSPEQEASLAAVTAQQGAAFDAAWTQQQIASHEASLALGQTELAAGSNAEVKGLATAAAPVVESHLAMLRGQGTPGSVGAGHGPAGHDSSHVLLLGVAGVMLGAAAVAVGRRPRTDAEAREAARR